MVTSLNWPLWISDDSEASSGRKTAPRRLPAIPLGGVSSHVSPCVLHTVNLLLHCYDGTPRSCRIHASCYECHVLCTCVLSDRPMLKQQCVLRARCVFSCSCRLLQCYDGNPHVMQRTQSTLQASCAFQGHYIRCQSTTHAEETREARLRLLGWRGRLPVQPHSGEPPEAPGIYLVVRGLFESWCVQWNGLDCVDGGTRQQRARAMIAIHVSCRGHNPRCERHVLANVTISDVNLRLMRTKQSDYVFFC